MGPWLRGGRIDYKQHNRICRAGGSGVVLLLVVVDLEDLMKLPKLIELCTQKDVLLSVNRILLKKKKKKMFTSDKAKGEAKNN